MKIRQNSVDIVNEESSRKIRSIEILNENSVNIKQNIEKWVTNFNRNYRKKNDDQFISLKLKNKRTTSLPKETLNHFETNEKLNDWSTDLLDCCKLTKHCQTCYSIDCDFMRNKGEQRNCCGCVIGALIPLRLQIRINNDIKVSLSYST